jgi:hypothetical protein
MPKLSTFKALCALSDTPSAVTPHHLRSLIRQAPDPETATRAVLNQLNLHSETLQRKWRQVVTKLWSSHHTHLPVLLNLPIATNDLTDVVGIQDALYFLQSIHNKPAPMLQENKEWLLTSEAINHLLINLPSHQQKLLIRIENEWQSLILRRLRSTLQELRLIRRLKNQLVIVKSRYQRFLALPTTQQYYLLWHTEAYHVDWLQFAGIWGDFLHVVQKYLPLLWEISNSETPNLPRDIRQWNQDIWDSFLPLWEQAGLFNRQNQQSTLLTIVRTQSLPTAVTQVIMKDLFERYGLICGEGELFAWTDLGTKIITAERTQELPCALDLIK